LLLWLFNMFLPGLGNLLSMGAGGFRQGFKMFLIGIFGIFFFHSFFAWLCLFVGLSVVGVVQLSTQKENKSLDKIRGGFTASEPKEENLMDSLGKDYTVSRYASSSFEEKVVEAEDRMKEKQLDQHDLAALKEASYPDQKAVQQPVKISKSPAPETPVTVSSSQLAVANEDMGVAMWTIPGYATEAHVSQTHKNVRSSGNT